VWAPAPLGALAEWTLPVYLVGVDVEVVADAEADQAVGVDAVLGEARYFHAIHLEHDVGSLHLNAERVHLAAAIVLLDDGGVFGPSDHTLWAGGAIFVGDVIFTVLAHHEIGITLAGLVEIRAAERNAIRSLVRRGFELRHPCGIRVVAGLGPVWVVEGARRTDDEMEHVARLRELELLGSAAVWAGRPAGRELAAIDDAVQVVPHTAGGYQRSPQEHGRGDVPGLTAAKFGRLGHGDFLLGQFPPRGQYSNN
jgi:hypothetical protein